MAAQAHFDAFPRSVKRSILEWIASAKTPATRAKRVEETARLAARRISVPTSGDALPDEVSMLNRQHILCTVAEMVMRLPRVQVVRVGIDGVDGAGKSMFGDELAQVLTAAGRSVIRASVDGFHNPRAVRYRLGRQSPEGYFRDSYNYEQLKALLLDPLSPGGHGRYRTAAFDHRTDQPVRAPEAQASPGDILVFDGIFLHRPELRSYWDCSIFLEVSVEVSMARCAQRDGTSPDPQAPGNRRYVEGQQLYVCTCAPWRHATVVINNESLVAPALATHANQA